MSNAQHHDCDGLVVDVANQTVITDAVFPVAAEIFPTQGLAQAARVGQWGDAFAQHLDDARLHRLVEAFQLVERARVELNPPGQARALLRLG